jgi:hypothetical protein
VLLLARLLQLPCFMRGTACPMRFKPMWLSFQLCRLPLVHPALLLMLAVIHCLVLALRACSRDQVLLLLWLPRRL